MRPAVALTESDRVAKLVGELQRPTEHRAKPCATISASVRQRRAGVPGAPTRCCSKGCSPQKI